MSVREFTEETYIIQGLHSFLMNRSAKYDFSEIYKIFNVTYSTNLGYGKCFLESKMTMLIVKSSIDVES